MVWIVSLVLFVFGVWAVRNQPLVLIILCVLIAGVVVYIEYDSRQVPRAPAEAGIERPQPPSVAQKPGGSAELQAHKQTGWTLIYRADPASGRLFARAASVTSGDGECTLSVRSPSNGKPFTDIKCQRVKFKPYEDLEIKFDHLRSSHSMDLTSHGAGRGTFIPVQQLKQAGHLSYEAFLAHLGKASAVALTSQSLGGRWIRFSAQNASEALSALGKPKPDSG
jgi:hypothetical protein